MYELKFTHKFGYIMRKYYGPKALSEMRADIQFYTENFDEGGGEYFYYENPGEMPVRVPLMSYKKAAGL